MFNRLNKEGFLRNDTLITIPGYEGIRDVQKRMDQAGGSVRSCHPQRIHRPAGGSVAKCGRAQASLTEIQACTLPADLTGSLWAECREGLGDQLEHPRGPC